MLEKDYFYSKNLDLVTPARALRYGLTVDQPVFISTIDSTDRKPFIYQVSEVLKCEYFHPENTEPIITTSAIIGREEDNIRVVHSRPRNGITFWKTPPDVTTNDSLFWSQMKSNGWVAILEPTSPVIDREDYFLYFNTVSQEVKVSQILAFCKVHSRDRRSEPLTEGVVIDQGNGYLLSACSYEKHEREIEDYSMPWFRFYYDHQGKIAFDYSTKS